MPTYCAVQPSTECMLQWTRHHYAGDETYEQLRIILNRIIPARRELKEQGIDLELDAELRSWAPRRMRTLRVELYLCSDHKLVATVLGHGGAGCKSCCPLCQWTKCAGGHCIGHVHRHGAACRRAPR